MAAVPRRRPYRRRIGLVLAVVMVVAVTGGQIAARRAAWRTQIARLRAATEVSLTARRAMAGNWSQLPAADRQAVCLVLLADPDLVWDATFDQLWLVTLLAEILGEASRPVDRARAARALGQMAVRTPLGGNAAPVPAGLEPAATALLTAVDRDPEGVVRSAAAAALMRVRPVARSYGLGHAAPEPVLP